MVAWLPRCFTGYPAAVLHVSSDGTVIDSNGRLERELNRVIVGQPFAAMLDPESSSGKWNGVIAGLGASTEPADAVVCELVLSTGDSLLEPRSFSVLWDRDAAVAWVIEHPLDPRVDDVRREVTEVNTELANTQRDLVRDRARLANALDLADRLTGQVSRQNERLAAQNEELLVITKELNEQRQALERSNRLLDEFARDISDDLGAPLRSVANYVRWIEEDLNGALTGGPRAHLELLRVQVERMRDMITSRLEHARAARTGGGVELVDVAALVDEVVAVLDPPPTCVIDVAPNLPVFETERAPLRQVFLSLIGNVIKHSARADVHVHVGVTETGGAYDFSVRDNGPSIPLRAQESIWMLLHTVPPPDSGGADGDDTRVGLALVRQLVETQGGHAWVESTEGHGSTFHFFWLK